VVSVFQHCDYGGWEVELGVGEYTAAALAELGVSDNNVSSLTVSPGYEAVLFEGDDFSGESITVTADTSCTVALDFNDLTSSIRIQEATGGGTGGSTGTGGGSGSGGSDNTGVGPTSCQPEFETVCKPQINFDNQQSNGGGALFDELFPDIENTMQDVACTVCSILYRNAAEVPQNRRYTTINLTIDNHDGVAYASGNSITISAQHLKNYTDPAKAYTEYRGVMTHETVHLYQNYGNGGTGEGMADCVRIRVGLYEPGRCNPGGSWKDAYTTSGCFYSWLTGPSSYHANSHPAADENLPYKLNAALAGTNGDAAYTAVSNVLQATFGQNADALWTQYQNDL
jgi:hypothetical protein